MWLCMAFMDMEISKDVIYMGFEQQYEFHTQLIFTNVMVCFQTFLWLIIGTLQNGITLLPWGVLVQT